MLLGVSLLDVNNEAKVTTRGVYMQMQKVLVLESVTLQGQDKRDTEVALVYSC